MRPPRGQGLTGFGTTILDHLLFWGPVVRRCFVRATFHRRLCKTAKGNYELRYVRLCTHETTLLQLDGF